jgi:hypothetical protein
MSELRSRRARRALEQHYEALAGPDPRVPLHRYAGQHGRVVSIPRFGITPGVVGAPDVERGVAGSAGGRSTNS